MILEWLGLRVVWKLCRPNKHCTRCKSRRGSRGFTLVESLTALAILAIALTALFQSYSSGLGAVRIIDNYTGAGILAESVLAQTMALPGHPRPGHGRRGKFTWRVTILPLGNAPQDDAGVKPFRLYAIAVRVAWPQNRSIELNAVRLAQKQ